ncbi:hypothetical protein CCACVL1_17512 [Corchorus capsularis]|uniref:Uncharacterized protein n=1 Tax=Corchorus capsularis TaxID=210143 RepID=A0A1R3HRI4_COCAP|nr:hypothetical protein CCACVL1_17512 [Corchorus capsularis]
MEPASSRFAPVDTPNLDLASTVSNTTAETLKKLNPIRNFEVFDLSNHHWIGLALRYVSHPPLYFLLTVQSLRDKHREGIWIKLVSCQVKGQ